MFGAAPQSTLCFRCKESDSPHAVTVYMLEPHSCQYILGVSKKNNTQEFNLGTHFDFWH